MQAEQQRLQQVEAARQRRAAERATEVAAQRQAAAAAAAAAAEAAMRSSRAAVQTRAAQPSSSPAGPAALASRAPEVPASRERRGAVGLQAAEASAPPALDNASLAEEQGTAATQLPQLGGQDQLLVSEREAAELAEAAASDDMLAQAEAAAAAELAASTPGGDAVAAATQPPGDAGQAAQQAEERSPQDSIAFAIRMAAASAPAAADRPSAAQQAPPALPGGAGGAVRPGAGQAVGDALDEWAALLGRNLRDQQPHQVRRWRQLPGRCWEGLLQLVMGSGLGPAAGLTLDHGCRRPAAPGPFPLPSSPGVPDPVGALQGGTRQAASSQLAGEFEGAGDVQDLANLVGDYEYMLRQQAG